MDKVLTVLRFWQLCWLFSGAFGFELQLIHDNDVHSRFKEFNALKQPCKPVDVRENQCYGGAARRSTVVKKMREKNPDLLYLCAGDQFQGTIWYTKFKGTAIAKVMNAIGYTAMSFGNHEFDDGLATLAPFMENITFPVLATNVKAANTEIDGLFKESMIVNVKGVKVGIVGYVTPETAFLSNPGPDVNFQPEISALKGEVKHLKDQGIKVILAVGHSGITKDKEICQKVDGVDIVVGGHTNTFLYSGNPPSEEIPFGPYPIVIDQEVSTQKCLVVTDFAYGKYLGNLTVQFDPAGNVQSWAGNPILLDQHFKEDPVIVDLLKPYTTQLARYREDVTGHTASGLDGSRATCRLKECNLGNLLADIIRDFFVNKTWEAAAKKGHWTEVSIALLNGGGIRDFYAKPGSPITLEDILTVFPFGNTIDRVEVNGSTLFQMFEHSVAGYATEDAAGKFLQVSGMRVTFDLNQPEYSRVVDLQVLCAKCGIPKYQQVALNKTYMLTTNSYLVAGGDGYSMLKQGHPFGVEELSDFDLVSAYVRRNKVVHAQLEDRIVFVENEAGCNVATINYVIFISIIAAFSFQFSFQFA